MFLLTALGGMLQVLGVQFDDVRIRVKWLISLGPSGWSDRLAQVLHRKSFRCLHSLSLLISCLYWR